MNQPENAAGSADDAVPRVIVSAKATRVHLGAELRRLREFAGVSGRDLAARVGISQSKLSRIETGTAVPSVPQVLAWADALDAPAGARDSLRRLTEAVHSEVKPWRSALDSRDHLQDEIGTLENSAQLVCGFQSSLIPGLLQTAEYARRVFTLFQVPYTKATLAAAIDARLHRQLALYDNEKRFEFLITESALRWRPGAPHLLLAQLDRLASVSTLDNVAISVIPSDATPATTIPHSFVIYVGGEDTTVSIETIHANMIVHAPEDVELYQGRWDLLRNMAIAGDQARDYLAALAAETRRQVGR